MIFTVARKYLDESCDNVIDVFLLILKLVPTLEIDSVVVEKLKLILIPKKMKRLVAHLHNQPKKKKICHCQI
jgi:hypothetical protein